MTKGALSIVAIGLSLVAPDGKALELSPSSTGGAVVRVVRATSQCFSDSIFVTGFVVPRQEALVSVYEGSRIVDVLAKEGDQVRAGQALARVTRPDGPPGGAAGPAAASSRSAAPMMDLKAPAAGLVIQSTAMPGAAASPRGEPTFRIMIDGEMEIEAEVPSIHVPKLKAEQNARINIEYGGEVNGRVRRVPGEIDRTSQIGLARLSIAPNRAVRVGMFARGTIEASQSCNVAVPREAVFVQTSGTSVQIVRDQRVETRRVRLGLASDTRFEVREGLRDGDIVIANAGTSLHDGDQVKMKFLDEPDN